MAQLVHVSPHHSNGGRQQSCVSAGKEHKARGAPIPAKKISTRPPPRGVLSPASCHVFIFILGEPANPVTCSTFRLVVFKKPNNMIVGSLFLHVFWWSRPGAEESRRICCLCVHPTAIWRRRGVIPFPLPENTHACMSRHHCWIMREQGDVPVTIHHATAAAAAAAAATTIYV